MKQRILRNHMASAVLTLLLVTGILAGCATSGVNRGDVNLISVQEEWRLGQQLEAEVARQMQLVNDPQALAYINQMGRAIVAQTEMRNLPWEFHIVRDPAINAFNIPGGHVYVNTGLIQAADNAAELAGVMAHEIAHGVARHGTERISRAYGLNIVASLVLGQNPSLVEQIVGQIVAGGAMAKFSRDDEREADRLGVRYMAAAGYNPMGMANMFEKLLSTRGRQPSRVSQFFSTHPLTEERIREVTRLASQINTAGLRMNDSGFATLKSRTR